MASTSQSIKLTYPIFDAQFDPYDRGYLVVCGGGGENRTGVPNKITLLDASARDELKEVVDLSLSTDEDSPQTLANVATKQGLIALVGISSSVADQEAGKNEHLRSFNIEFPAQEQLKDDKKTDEKTRTAKPPVIQFAGQSALFKPPTVKNSRTYQRIMKLSPVRSREATNKRIGALATADAAENEIVLFDATTFIPKTSSVLQRLSLQSEAEDLDLYQFSEGSFGLAYCTTQEVYLYLLECNFSKKTSDPVTKTPALIYSIPKSSSGSSSKIRSIRWLTHEYLLILVNNQPRGAPELCILRLDLGKKISSHVVQRKTLPKKMSIGVRVAVCQLDADPGSGERQVVFAVAGQNLSIHLFTVDVIPNATSTSTIQNFSVIDVSSQHDHGISALAFGNFFSPRQSADSPKSVASEKHYINLVSTSLSSTVSVESIPLTSTPSSPSSTSSNPVASQNSNSTNRPSIRWVLSKQSTGFNEGLYLFVGGISILILAFIFQSFVISKSDVGSDAAPIQDAFSKGSVFGSSASFAAHASASSVYSDVSSIIGSAGDSAASEGSSSLSSISSTATSIASSASGSASDAVHRLADLLHIHRHALSASSASSSISSVASSAAQSASDTLQAALHIEAPENPYADPSEIQAGLHKNVEELRAKGAKKFDELTENEQNRWKERLTRAGRWTESEGVAILQSVLFSEYAGIVGGGIRDAVLGN